MSHRCADSRPNPNPLPGPNSSPSASPSPSLWPSPKPLLTPSLTLTLTSYHRECFKCAACTKPLFVGFTIGEDGGTQP